LPEKSVNDFMRPIPFIALRGLAVRILCGVIIDALLTAACYASGLNLASASLLFLLGVVAQALHATFASSVIASVIAAVFLDYFFVTPVLTWRIASPFDFIGLVAFVTVSVVITRLTSKAQQQAGTAEQRLKTLEQIYQCSERLLALDPAPGLIPGVLKAYKEIFGLSAACFFDGGTAEGYIEGESGNLAALTRHAWIAAGDFDDPDRRVCVRCLRSRGKVTAAIGFENLRDPEVTARSLVAMTVATLDRATAFQAASISAAQARTEVFRAAVLDALAHEIKTPLAAILAAAGGLRETVRPGERELAEDIETEALRLTDLTSSLLRKAEMECEQIQARMKDVDLESLIASLVERYARHYGDHTLCFDCGESYIEGVHADEELLRLALSQLLDNAVKYSPPGARIVVRLESRGQSVGVRVWNNRSSLLPADRPRIFERFYRGANTRHLVAGSGLGLYITQKIARTHNGTLTLETQGDGLDGIAFCLTLPKENEYGTTRDHLTGGRR
jgi:two-component system, OmpR family, sensor histidine kinase KdpD